MWYIHTSEYGLSMYMYVSGVWDYLSGPVKNTEPYYDRMTFSELLRLKHFSLRKYVLSAEVWLKWCFFFLYTYEFLTFLLGILSMWIVQLSLLFPHFFLLFVVFLPFLLVLLWKWGKTEAQRYLVCLRPPCPAIRPPPPPLLPALSRMKAGDDCFILSWWFEHWSWALDQL